MHNVHGNVINSLASLIGLLKLPEQYMVVVSFKTKGQHKRWPSDKANYDYSDYRLLTRVHNYYLVYSELCAMYLLHYHSIQFLLLVENYMAFFPKNLL